MKTKLLLLAVLATLQTLAQPVKWQITVSGSKLKVNCIVAKGWHLYTENLQTSIAKEIKYDAAPVIFFDPLFGKNEKIFSRNFSFTQTIPANEKKIIITAFASNDKEYLPIEDTLVIGTSLATDLKIRSIDLTHPVSSCGDVQNTNRSLLAIFMLGFGGGLLALLTPCVFPMIPATVSYFTSKASYKNGILYGLCIFLIYAAASIPFHLIGNINPQVFNIVSTSAGVNIFFFTIFILFALSFFGLFHIKLPSAIANSAGNKGGIFFMALTLAIVSFSCTGPILGSLLVGSLSSEGGAWQLTFGMMGFGIALALPFTLFAMFPGWLKALPKSGGWMDTVKVSLAFVELALAIKFLSNADLVKHWGILKREIFIGLWIIIALALSVYLFSKSKKIVALIVCLFAIYLIPGLTRTRYANLTLLSGFPPPLSYSIYNKTNDVLKNDYEKALQLSREQHKPILIDFTGWACVNCRKMEEQVWSNPEVAALIKDKFILVSLYVDDRKKIADQSFRTVGEKWARFQEVNFNQVSQPLYVIISPGEMLMNNPVGYTPNISSYKNWLKCGIEAYQKSNE